jgi:hypothetical protein
MHNRLAGLVALTISALTLGLVLAGPTQGALDVNDARAATNAAAGRAMTLIVLRVDRCRHCPAYVQQALDDGTYWTSRTHRVRAGHVRFRVPTHRTYGMSFVFNPRWANVTDAVTNVVTRYAHTQVGDRVSNRVAKKKRRATACWAGTDARRVRMLVRAVKFRGPALGGGEGHALRAWFQPMKSATPPKSPTYRGSLGNQDAYYCKA